MLLKVGRHIFDDISNKDWILDNGACYQIMTRRPQDYSRFISVGAPVIMSKKLFAQLVKEKKLIQDTELENTENFKTQYSGRCSAWRFNVD